MATVMPQVVIPLVPALKPKLHEDTVAKLNLVKVRYVWSPRLTLDVTWEKCELNTVESQRITLVDNYQYPDRNHMLWGEHDTGPDWILHTRPPGHIVAGLIREFARDGERETGFCELDSLIGLDPEVQGTLLEDIQYTLCPFRHETGQGMIEWLNSRDVTGPIEDKPINVRPYYERTHYQLLEGAHKSLAHAQWRKDQIVESFNNFSMNKRGFSAKIGPAERAIFRWLGEEPPEIINPAMPQRQRQLDVNELGAAIGQAMALHGPQAVNVNEQTSVVVSAVIEALIKNGALPLPMPKAEPIEPTDE